MFACRRHPPYLHARSHMYATLSSRAFTMPGVIAWQMSYQLKNVLNAPHGMPRMECPAWNAPHGMPGIKNKLEQTVA